MTETTPAMDDLTDAEYRLLNRTYQGLRLLAEELANRIDTLIVKDGDIDYYSSTFKESLYGDTTRDRAFLELVRFHCRSPDLWTYLMGSARRTRRSRYRFHQYLGRIEGRWRDSYDSEASHVSSRALRLMDYLPMAEKVCQLVTLRRIERQKAKAKVSTR